MAGDAKRLVELGTVPPLADEIARQIEAASTGEAAQEARAAADDSEAARDASQMAASDAALSRDQSVLSAASAAALGKFYPTLAGGLSATSNGDRFTTTDAAVKLRDDNGNLTGQTNAGGILRAIMRDTSLADGYRHLGPGADPLDRGTLAQPDGSGLVGFFASAAGAVLQKLSDKLYRSLSWEPEDFGAVGDGVTDDTAAMLAFLNAVNTSTFRRRGYIPTGKNYYTDGFRLESRRTLWSECPTGSGTGTQDLSELPQITLKSGASAIALVDVGGTRGPRIRGVQLNGNGQGKPCITAGSSRMSLDYVRAINGSYGVGGAGSAGDSYTRTMTAAHCTLAANSVAGVGNLVDSSIQLCDIAGNYDGIRCSGGASSNRVVDTRIEWNTNRNWNLSGSSDSLLTRWTIANCQVDRGGLSSLFRYCRRVNVGDTWWERAGRALAGILPGDRDPQDDCLIALNNSAYISFSNCGYKNGVDDGGGSVFDPTPSYAFYFNLNCANVSIAGGTFDPTNFTGFARSTSNCSALRISGIPGVPDISTDPANIQVNGPLLYRGLAATGNIAAGANTTVALQTLLTLAPNTNRALPIRIVARNQDTGTTISGMFLLEIRRAGTTSTATLREVLTNRPALPAAYGSPTPPTASATYNATQIQDIINAVAANNKFLRTAPNIGLTGNGILQLSVSAVVDDGSSIDIMISNTGTVAYAVQEMIIQS